MIKRKSMLGRRNRAQQSPSAFQSQAVSWDRPDETPRQMNKSSLHPFSTPGSMNGSLSNIGATSSEPWSVFKNVRGLKSPGRKANIMPTPQPVSMIRRHCQQKTAERKTTKKIHSPVEIRPFDTSQSTACRASYSSALQSDFTSFSTQSYANGPANSIKTSDTNFLKPSHPVRVAPILPYGKEEALQEEKKSDSGFSQELSDLKKQWDAQDISNVSPPWSNGMNTLTDFNFHTPLAGPSSAAAAPILEGKETNLTSPFGVFPLDSTTVTKDANEETEKGESTYTVLEKPVREEVGDGTIDLRTALCDVSLGVNSLEILDKHNMANMYKTNWGSKYKSPLPRLSEGPEASKENVPPSKAVVSPLRDESHETIGDSNESDSDTRSSENWNAPGLMKQFRDRISALNSKIEAADEGIRLAEEKRRQAEEERRQAEEERRVLESEKKRIVEELIESMDRPCGLAGLPIKKRRIAPSSAKKRPSFIASKLLKKDCKSPKVFVDPSMRTPNLKPGRASMKFNMYTPKSLSKSLNQQFDSIFK